MGSNVDGCVQIFGRVLIFLYLIIFFGGGLVVLSTGAAFAVSIGGYSPLLGPFLLKSPIVLIVKGALMLASLVCGCTGVAKQAARKMLVTFCALASLSFLLAVVGASLAVHDNSQLGEPVTSNFIGQCLASRLEADFKVEGVPSAFDALQREFSCCGISGPQNWRSLGLEPPASCCAPRLVCNRTSTPPRGLFAAGCAAPLSYKMRSRLVPLAVVSGVFGIVEVFGLALLWIITCSSEEEEE